MMILYACYLALINPRSIFIVIEAIHAWLADKALYNFSITTD